MGYNYAYIGELWIVHEKIKGEISNRIAEFKAKWKNGTEEEIFAEFAFCIFTPQSKAKSCWQAVNQLIDKKILYTGKAEEISSVINLVRFRNKKGEYLVAARDFFTENGKIVIKQKLDEIKGDQEKRKFLVNNIKGMGYKEGAHFLRNVGFVEELSILDRHILKNLVRLGVIEEIPKALTVSKYFEIEEKMVKFSNDIKMGMADLDMILWYKEAGEVFK